MSKTAKSACALAFLMAALCLVAAFTIGPTLLAVGAIIAGIAGVGILRGDAWSAYGFALCISLQVMIVTVRILNFYGSNSLQLAISAIALAVIIGIAMAALMFRAGRSLEEAEASRGRAWPWIAVSLLTCIPFCFLQAYMMPSASMENTVLIGDRLLVRVWPKPLPGRDDIWVFHYPLNHREAYLKRIVGMPGDRIHFSNKVVYRNGTALIEPYVEHYQYHDSYRDNFPSAAPNLTLPEPAMAMLENDVVDGEVIVPKDHYFVLGDNRDDSSDSRYWGFVATSELIGKPWIIYDSREMPVTITRPSSFTIGKPRWDRFFRRL